MDVFRSGVERRAKRVESGNWSKGRGEPRLRDPSHETAISGKFS
jgi:hypothetical protein